MPTKAVCDYNGKGRRASCEFEYYTNPSQIPPVVIEGLVCRQKDKVFYIGAASAADIDMMTDIPSVDYDMKFEDLANGFLGGALNERWQRPLSSERIRAIGEFFADPRNYFVNAVLIALKPETESEVGVQTSVSPGGTTEVALIKIPPWLRERCPRGHTQTVDGKNVFSDRCLKHDCPHHKRTWRPAVLIDGQHRIRGIQKRPSLGTRYGGSNVNALPIPFTLLRSSGTTAFPPQEQAKVFTEITTQARDLEKLHKLWLLYRFEMRGGKMFVGAPGIDMRPRAGVDQRAAYETILELCSTRHGVVDINPWRNRIPILRGVRGRTSIASIDRLFPLFVRWFKKNGPFWDRVNRTRKSPAMAAQEMIQYVNAIRKTWSGRTSAGELYWSTSASRGILSHPEGGEMNGFFRTLLRLYPTICGQIDGRGGSHVIAEFERELKRISKISWTTTGWSEIKAPDRNLALLLEILTNYLSGKSVQKDLGRPGKGADLNTYIASSPMDFALKLVHARKGRPPVFVDRKTLLRWRMPFNAYPSATLSFEQDGQPTGFEGRIKTQRDKETEFVLDTNKGLFDPAVPGSLINAVVTYHNHMGLKEAEVGFKTP
jgi:hypothetical protein